MKTAFAEVNGAPGLQSLSQVCQINCGVINRPGSCAPLGDMMHHIFSEHRMLISYSYYIQRIIHHRLNMHTTCPKVIIGVNMIRGAVRSKACPTMIQDIAVPGQVGRQGKRGPSTGRSKAEEMDTG